MTIQQALEIVFQHYQVGRLGEAEAVCRQILAAEAGNADALHMLGVIAGDVGRHDLAVELMHQAIAARPNFPEAHHNLGLTHYEKGQLDQAIAAYGRAIALKPEFSEAHNNLGAALRDSGQLDDSIASCRQAIALNPNFAEAYNNLCNGLRDKGRLAEAIAACRQAVALQPNNARIHNNLGTVLTENAQMDEAIAAFRQAVALHPSFAEAHNNLGHALREIGQLMEAIAAFRNAIALDSKFVEAHNNLGNALRENAQLVEAIAVCRQAVALNPECARAHNNLGNALFESGRLAEAVETFRRAAALDPDLPQFRNSLGMALTGLGRLKEALAAFDEAIALDPNYPEAHSNLIFTLDLVEGIDLPRHQEERRRWYEQHARQFSAQITPHENKRDPDRRLRVGYVSADFRKHSAAYIFTPVVCGHDRTEFEVFCYSGVKREDDVTARLRQAAQEWRSTTRMSDADLAAQIRQDRIDILVDLAGHSAGNRLLVFARKPAPVQIVAWGYCNGTGVKAIDYLFGDAVVVPTQDRGLYAEEVFDLHCVIGYEAPDYLPEVSPLPCLQGSPVTYGCVNRIEKITDRTIELWGRILQEAPDSRLLVKERSFDDTGFRQQFLNRLQRVGRIDADRVLLLGASPHAEHFRVFHQIDIGLDPFPHGGGVSTAEALWMSVPPVTLLGDTVPGRISASMLNMVGLREWVAETEDEYVGIALQARRELPRVAKQRQELRERLIRSPWGKGRYTRAVEQAYRQMWRRWCAAERPIQPS